MITGTTKRPFHEKLLALQIDIFNSIGLYPSLNKKYTNPLRIDKRPGCTFSLKNGIWFFNDWARPEYSGHAFHIKSILENGVSISSPTTLSKKSSRLKLLTYKQELSLRFVDYFRDANINIHKYQKGKYQVKEISRMIYDDFAISPDDLSISYIFPSSKVKIYRPFNEKYKWSSNTSANDIWGFEKDKDKYVLTSSMKDALTVEANTNYCGVAPQSETTKIDKELLLYMRDRKLVIIYDNDEVGRKQAAELAQLDGITTAFVPEEYKDPYKAVVNNFNLNSIL